MALYSDDKKVLPESDWVTTDAGKVLKSLGKINSYYALKTYGVNAQPYYVSRDGTGNNSCRPADTTSTSTISWDSSRAASKPHNAQK